MEEEKLFRIGNVAKMFHISTGTLRHYERIGIVVPEFIEEKSSYRYYGIRQFEVLNTIRYLRVLDMPLEQIADFLANRDIQVIEEKLQNQKEMIREKEASAGGHRTENRPQNPSDPGCGLIEAG